MGITSREPGTVRGNAKRPHFSLAFISVTVQLWTWVFWVISLYFNIRNTLPKFGTFLLGHPIYIFFNVCIFF